MPSPTAPPTSSPLDQDQPNTAYAHITEVSGDLLSMAEIGIFDLIAHGCNCFHTMGAGIALALARRFPDIRTADRRTVYGDRKKLGTYSTARVYAGQSAKLLTILNCYTQYHYGFQTTHTPNCSYPAIEKVMIAINRNFTGQHLGIPRIGSGLAKGKWPLIREIIGQSTPDIKVTIIHYSK